MCSTASKQTLFFRSDKYSSANHAFSILEGLFFADAVVPEIVGIVSTLHSALQASTNHYSTLKKCRYRYWILPKFVTFL